MTADTNVVLCACGCGQPVSEGKEWRRGHASRGRGGGGAPSEFAVLAGESEVFGDTIDVDGDPPPTPSAGPAPDETGETDTHAPSDHAGPPGPDEPPAHTRREPRRRRRPIREADGGAGPRKPTRITVAIRGDIESKISFALEIPGRIWQARDPVCGTTFVEQRAEIATAMTEIVCGSPDLVDWFTGAGGQFMLYLNLAAACWPVATMVLAHHVYHTVALEEGGAGYGPAGQPDLSRYAA
jgi:hypothetical protein